ncbi:MAG: dienelactone hydrolase [Actinomycetia bacterium]|jgi:predicted alpha/beta-hydrolase family hydrolase|nr:dienelactone hydrolase [Actinomycetes bacterium]
MTAPEESLRLETVKGPITAAYARPRSPFATIVVAHGAGAGMDHPFLVGFARACFEEGIAALRFNFPYVESGRRSPDTEGVLRDAWRAAFEAASDRAAGDPVWASGKSLGGRIASMAAAEGDIDPAGLVFLGYPLHPPGKPERIRDEHLYRIEAPMLFLQGTSDPFASPELLRSVVEKLGALATLVPFDGGGHSFEVRGRKRDPHEVGASLAPQAASFIRDHG